MTSTQQLFLSYQLIKAAATAPQVAAGGVGGATTMSAANTVPGIAKTNLGGGTKPFASMLHDWTDNIAKSPVAGAAADPMGAGGGYQAAAAARSGLSTASWLDQFKNMSRGWGRTAHF